MSKIETLLENKGGEKTYIIAEAGQNHNGDIKTAKQLIDMAAMPIYDKWDNAGLPGVDAIKFTKRDLALELTDDAMNKPYDSPHSFGKTYGEHRKALELNEEQHAELCDYAHEKGLEFIETLCAPRNVHMLDIMDIDAIKVASRDHDNIPLLQAIAATHKPIVISTGMVTYENINHSLDVLARFGATRIAILHCISEYPARYENINMRNIGEMQVRYPNQVIGYSDHSIGIALAGVAVSLGARIIEKHVTLNHNMKGSDHAGSLEPEGLWRMVRDIRNIERAMGSIKKKVPDSVKKTKIKLGRSIATSRIILKGAKLTEDDLCMLSPGDGLGWDERRLILGKRARKELLAHSSISAVDFE
jgi:3-deoxy-D-glycero-D-galacto-nononate 9-phosphate synthase